MEVSKVGTEFGLDEEAWSMWVEYRKQIRKPLRSASLALAQKRLAALGPQQREAVEYSIANGYQGLFAPKSAQKVIRQINNDASEMLELRVRAEKIGFRMPVSGEDVICYRMMVVRAEDANYLKQRRLGQTSVAQLLGAKA